MGQKSLLKLFEQKLVCHLLDKYWLNKIHQTKFAVLEKYIFYVVYLEC